MPSSSIHQLQTKADTDMKPSQWRGAKLCCEITQGVTDRREARGNTKDAWLRANDRTTWFNTTFALGEQSTLVHHDLFKALTGANENNECTAVGAIFTCQLVYADTQAPIPMLQEGRCKEKVTVIQREGTTKSGFTVRDSTLAFATASARAASPNMELLSAEDYFEVHSLHGSTTDLAFSFKFSTNVTSRRHGRRNAGRAFLWQIQMQLLGACAPHNFSAQSHKFLLISRPVIPETAQSKTVAAPAPAVAVGKSSVPSLDEVVSDGRPGDIVTCVGDHLNGQGIYAELLQSTQGPNSTATLCHLAHLTRAKESKRVFISRLPSDLPQGMYWIRMCRMQQMPQSTVLLASLPCPITVMLVAAGGRLSPSSESDNVMRPSLEIHPTREAGAPSLRSQSWSDSAYTSSESSFGGTSAGLSLLQTCDVIADRDYNNTCLQDFCQGTTEMEAYGEDELQCFWDLIDQC